MLSWYIIKNGSVEKTRIVRVDKIVNFSVCKIFYRILLH